MDQFINIENDIYKCKKCGQLVKSGFGVYSGEDGHKYATQRLVTHYFYCTGSKPWPEDPNAPKVDYHKMQMIKLRKRRERRK